jgi:AcrR family transcriptional regulator
LPTTAGTLQDRKQEFVRGAIWDAAVDLFVQKGYDETTVEDIARAAGVSRRSFFRYFSSKGDLMGESIVTYGTAVCDAVHLCPRSWPPMQVVHQTVLEVARAAALYPRTRRIMEIVSGSTAAREAQLARRAEAEDRVAQAYAGRCGASGADVTARLLTGLTFAILDVTFRVWFDNGDRDIGHTAEQVFGALGRLIPARAALTRRRPSR